MRTNWCLGLVLAIAACDRPSSGPPPPAASPTPTTRTSAPVASAAPVAPVASTDAAAAPSGVLAFDADPLGAPPPSLEPVVGDWVVAEESGARGVKVDGSRWRNGTPSVDLADQAKRLYGDRYAEFLDGVKAFAFFPFAVAKAAPPEGDLRLSVRFYPIAGKVDQAAGLAFGIAPDGSYLGVRANALEDNLLFFRVVKGKRTVIDNVRDVPTPTKTWHTLVVTLHTAKLEAELDGQKRFEKTLDAAPKGRVGLWSKADSQVLFDDFRVEPLR